MSTLAQEISMLEFEVFTLIDELDYNQDLGGSKAYELKEELNRKRAELLWLKTRFDRLNGTDQILRLVG